MTDIKEKYINSFFEDSLKAYRDLKNSIDTAREEGIIEGEIKGVIQGKIESKNRDCQKPQK